MTIKIANVATYLEQLAPLAYQEPYDNCGLLVGDQETPVTGVLCALDCTPALLEEALEKKCNLVIVHHPIIFRPLKNLVERDNTTRCLTFAIQHKLAIYALHTNFDQVLNGVNQALGEKIGLTHLTLLKPKESTTTLLTTMVTPIARSKVKIAIYQAIGRRDKAHSHPATEEINPVQPPSSAPHDLLPQPLKIVIPTHRQDAVLVALRKAHPHNPAPHHLQRLSNSSQRIGSGMIGQLPTPQIPTAFLDHLKTRLNLHSLRHTVLPAQPIHKVAYCGGAGSSLLPQAVALGADAFITADVRYHDFFDVPPTILLADIGHYESEVVFKKHLQKLLQNHFPTLPTQPCTTITNPIRHHP